MTAIFITILNMSITAGIVALAVMLARVPLRKAPKVFSYALWGVVLFRLIFPFSIESIFSLMPTDANVIPQDIVVSQNPVIHTGIQFIDVTVNNALPTAVIENSVNPIHVVLEIAGYVWLAGFIALLLYAAIGYMNLKRRVYFATLVRDNIFESDRIKTPFVLGLIRPKIYFPVTINPEQHDYILKHEQTHIRRRDYIIKPFAFAVLALHWFNPVIWISYFLMSKDMEMSCDEAVLRKTDEDIRSDYSTALLSLSVEKFGLLNPIAFAFGESNVKERVVNVLCFKKTAKWVSVVSFIAVAAFLVGFTSDRVSLAAVGVPYTPAPFPTAFYQPTSEQEVERMIERFEIYREFGLIYDPTSDRLYFDGELVRYFEDIIPLPDYLFGAGAKIGITHFTENGTVDIRAVRDFSVVIQMPDGRTNHSLLVGLEPSGQEEFDARDIDEIRRWHSQFGDIAFPSLDSWVPPLDSSVSPLPSSDNRIPPLPSQSGQASLTATAEMPQDTIWHSQFGDTTHPPLDSWVPSLDSSVPPLPSSYNRIPPLPSQSEQASLTATAETPQDTIIGSRTLTETLTEIFLGIEEFGITFDGNLFNGGIGNIYYNGQLVRTLFDGNGTSLSSSDRSGNINVRTVSDSSGSITGVEVSQVQGN